MSTGVIRVDEAIQAFPMPGELVGSLRYGQGHVNDTFCVYTQQENGDCIRYILQRMNRDVFPDPQALMENIVGVTKHIAKKAESRGEDPSRATMEVIPTKDDKMFYMDADGFAWRVYAFVENSYYLQTIEHSEDFFEAAVGFGTFQSALADYDASKLHEIIPKFHDTRLRIQQLEAAMEADPKKRLSTVGPEIACIFERREKASYLMDMLEKNLLPLRVTHNDTKLNNILFDKDSRKAAVVIDLDTVMPGLIAFDFGDAIRFGANTAAEDEMDLQKVSLSLELFDIYTRGFMESAGKSLSENEIESLPWGAYLMTFEVGIRFLTDYLNGDQYFHVQREHHNLDRARTQLRLILDMEKKWNEMHTIVKKYAL